MISFSSCALLSRPEPTPDPSSIIINDKKGSVLVMVEGSLKEISNNGVLSDSQKLITYKTSAATVRLPDQSKIQLGEFTTIQLLNSEIQTQPLSIELESGEVWITLESGEMEVKTETGTASVTGSVMHVFFSQVSKNLIVSCLEGECKVGNTVIPAGMKVVFYANGNSPSFYSLSKEEIDLWIEKNPNTSHSLTQLTATAWAEINKVEPTKTPKPDSTEKEISENCELNTSWNPKIIKIGETLSTIAFSSGITISELAEGNCIKTTERLSVGAVVFAPEPKPFQSSINIACGPPVGWITYTIQGTETLSDVAGAYQATIKSMQLSNCLGNSQAVFIGMVLFVPNVIPVTLTPMPTITPTFVIEINTTTGGGTTGGTTEETADDTSGDSSGGGTVDDDFISVSSVTGPQGTISSCINEYRIHVNDSDGFQLAQLIYDFNNSDMSGDKFFNMADLGTNSDGDDMFKKTISLNTADTPGATSVYYRFKFKDKLGNVYYVPQMGTAPYQFLDSLYCNSAGLPFTTNIFDNKTGPTGAQSTCELDYNVKVSDPDGIKQVEIAYSTTDPTLNTIDGKKLMNKFAGSSTQAYYELKDYIITASNGDTVYYRFEMQDLALNTVVDSTIYSYTSQTCTASTATSYIVSFDTDGGTSIANQSIVENSYATRPASNPTKTGHTFDDWYTDGTFATLWNFGTMPITSTTTIYAKFDINSYTVSFDTDGGSAVSAQSIDYNTYATRPASNPTKTGYTFDDWYTDGTFGTLWNFGTMPITSTTTIYTKFDINSYTVSFDTDGGSAVAAQSIDYNTYAIRPASNPTKSGFTFDDWYTDGTFATLWNFGTMPITGTTTIYANWTP